MPKVYERRHPIWFFFHNEIGDPKVACKYCEVWTGNASNPSNMKKHLEKHTQEYAQYLENLEAFNEAEAVKKDLGERKTLEEAQEARQEGDANLDNSVDAEINAAIQEDNISADEGIPGEEESDSPLQPSQSSSQHSATAPNISAPVEAEASLAAECANGQATLATVVSSSFVASSSGASSSTISSTATSLVVKKPIISQIKYRKTPPPFVRLTKTVKLGEKQDYFDEEGKEANPVKGKTTLETQKDQLASLQFKNQVIELERQLQEEKAKSKEAASLAEASAASLAAENAKLKATVDSMEQELKATKERIEELSRGGAITAEKENSFDAYKKLLANDLNLESTLNLVPYQITQVPLYRRDGSFKKKSQPRKGSHLQRIHRTFNDEKEDGDDEILIVSTRDSTFSTPASFAQRSRSSLISSSVVATAQYFNDVEHMTSLNLNSSAIATRFEKSLRHRNAYDSTLIVELDEVNSARNEEKKGQTVMDELRTKLEISGIKTPIAKPEKKRLIDLPAAAEDLIARVWNSSASQTEVMGKCFGVEIMRKDLLTLRPSQWLNDEVINAFLSLVVDRSKKSSQYPKAYTFNTFFYKNIRDPNKGYKSVARWTCKVDIFVQELIFVPVHLDVHWCMAIINMIEQKIEYYDSMAGYSNSDQCLGLLLDYLVKEAENKKKPFNPKEWSTVFREDCRQQKNGYDCGVFSCLFAEYASRRADLTFTQDDINYYRKRIVWEICNASMLES